VKIHPNEYQFDITQNDCQNLVINLYPEVANLLQWLLQFAPSRMTGTGACVFAVFDQQREALEIRDKLPPDWQGFVARGVDQSPLLSMISEQD
jgi:4-diphosphocytidyl-2-C-methyl-D-erythritol kinase